MEKPKFPTFEDFCKHYGVDATLPVITGVSEKTQKQMIATYIWELMVHTLNNEGQETEWVADYDNRDQIKYELYVYKPSSGSGWSLGGVVDWRAYATCGARRVFRTREIGYFAAEHLLRYYIDTF